jgi:ComF family protein
MPSKFNQMQKCVSSVLDNLISFVYPPQCVICGCLHENNRFFICPKCEPELMQFSVPLCMTCRNPLDDGDSKCSICGGKPLINRVWAAGGFDDFYRPLIHAFKYDGVIPIGDYLGKLIANIMQLSGFDEIPDLIMPIPLHSSRLRYRGFDQSLLIAKALGEALDIKVEHNILKRVKKTRDQTGLNREQRITNMKGAFTVDSGHSLKNSSIILIDDVTTSGATALGAARALKRAGAAEIVLAVAAAAGLQKFE